MKSYTRDALGFPSVENDDFFDAAWSRGWFHATDRLVQVQLTLLAAQGRMMEHLGDEPLLRMVDRTMRHLDLGRDLDAQVDALTPEARRMVEAYCDGFNQGVKDRGWPWVLSMAVGVKPQDYTAHDMIRLYRLLCWFGLTSTQHIAEVTVTELIARGAPREAFDLLLGDAAEGLDLQALANLEVHHQLVPSPLMSGSNAFAVAGSRSASGGALLMGEFHMEIARFPPIVYASHHSWPGGTYSGLSVPGLCWLSAGRTDDIAYTYTNGHGDGVDILVERCNEGKYDANGTWKVLDRREEKIFVKGTKEPERVVFWDNDYGSIDGDAMEGGDLPCVRWSGMRDKVANDINIAYDIHLARDVEDFRERHRGFAVLSMNAVVADRHGDVGQFHMGQVDERPEGWTGAYPRKGWDLDSRTPAPRTGLPTQLRPASGFTVSANERVDPAWINLPEPEYRAERLTDLLSGVTSATERDLVRASYDVHDLCMDRLAPVWKPLLPQDVELDASHFHALHHEALIAVMSPHIGAETARRFFDELGFTLHFQYHLDKALALERPDLVDKAALRQVLATAWPLAQKRVATGKTAYPATIRFKNLVTQGKLPAFLGFSPSAFQLAGTPTTPFQVRTMDMLGEHMVGGPVFHFVCDMSKPGAWYHVCGGASERRFGPGYGTGLDLWREGRFLPLGNPEGSPPDLTSD